MDKFPVKIISIDTHHAERRIDNYLLNYLKGVPKSLLYRLIRQGQIRVNKKRIKTDYRLKAGDEIRLPPISLDRKEDLARPSQSLIETLEKAVLYEDERLIVLNKPAGLAVHGGSGVSCGLIEALRKIWSGERYLELAHRLDRDTSGCIIIAKKPKILRELHQLLREGKIKKQYIALTLGHWPKEHNRVDISLEKNVLSSGERKVKASDEGKRSLTIFHVVKRFSHCELVEIDLQTGRMHQIRAHAQLSGHPIAGDDKYGDRAFNRMMQKSYHLKRLFLHSQEVSFQLPDEKDVLTLKAPLGSALVELISCL